MSSSKISAFSVKRVRPSSGWCRAQSLFWFLKLRDFKRGIILFCILLERWSKLRNHLFSFVRVSMFSSMTLILLFESLGYLRWSYFFFHILTVITFSFLYFCYNPWHYPCNSCINRWSSETKVSSYDFFCIFSGCLEIL